VASVPAHPLEIPGSSAVQPTPDRPAFTLVLHSSYDLSADMAFSQGG
jgi:hypothetical protein